MVRCKMKLVEIREHAGALPGLPAENKTFVFTPEYDSDIEEDRRFNKYSPSGRFEITCNNPAVIEQYKIGTYWYFDSSPVPAAE
jgi:hypothetical protein